MTYGQLKALIAIANSKGMPDSAPVRFAAGATGVDANAKIEINEAANIRAGHYVESSSGETVLEAPELVFNQ